MLIKNTSPTTARLPPRPSIRSQVALNAKPPERARVRVAFNHQRAVVGEHGELVPVVRIAQGSATRKRNRDLSIGLLFLDAEHDAKRA
jgi:hypothetical protein